MFPSCFHHLKYSPWPLQKKLWKILHLLQPSYIFIFTCLIQSRIHHDGRHQVHQGYPGHIGQFPSTPWGVAVLFRQGTPWSESQSWSMQSSWPIAWFFRSSHVTYTVSSLQIFIIIFHFLFNLEIPPTERENMNESCFSFLPCLEIYNDRNRLPTTHKYDLQPLTITKPGKHMIFPWCALFPAASCQAARLDCGRWEVDRFRQMSPG